MKPSTLSSLFAAAILAATPAAAQRGPVFTRRNHLRGLEEEEIGFVGAGGSFMSMSMKAEEGAVYIAAAPTPPTPPTPPSPPVPAPPSDSWGGAADPVPAPPSGSWGGAADPAPTEPTTAATNMHTSAKAHKSKSAKSSRRF